MASDPQPHRRKSQEMDLSLRTCTQCGMLLDRAGEFHPYLFCILKKAGRDPWTEVRRLNDQLGLVKELPDRPPLVRELRPGRER